MKDIIGHLKLIKDVRDPIIKSRDILNAALIKMDDLGEYEGYRLLIDLDFNNINDFTHIVIHHSLTKDSGTVSWGAIKRWHMGRIPGSPYHMRDIGYHFGVERIDKSVKILPGRPLTQIGSHTRGFNTSGIGICIVGDYDQIEPPEAHLKQALILTKWLMLYCNIPKDKVIGHREVYPILKKPTRKSCPGKLFDMDKYREALT